MADDELPSGHVRFLDSFQPGLPDDRYTITVSHTLDQQKALGATIDKVTQDFVVAGPRFTLDPADIHARFPPNGASSAFAEVLPHIVLNKRLLPWERKVPKLAKSVPWLALLVLQDDEIIGSKSNDPNDPEVTRSVIANYAQTMTVKQLLDTPKAQALVPDIDQTKLMDDEKKMSCQVITISNDTFARIMPTARELPYLAHAREVDTGSKIVLDLQNAGLFSVVVANRFPRSGAATRGAKNIAHLVSLEGYGDFLGGTAPKRPDPAQVKLVSLCSWTFSCVPDPQQKFSGLAQNLAYIKDGNDWKWRAAESLALRLPLPDKGGDGARQRLSDGYVALGYHAVTGEDGFAWYRGPLIPSVAKVLPESPPFQTAAAAIIFDPRTGTFDHSQAAAWQAGRALALAEESFATALMRLRRKARLQVDQAAHQTTSMARPAAGQKLSAMATSATTQQNIHAKLTALFAGGTAVNALAEASRATRFERPPQTARVVAAAAAVAPPVRTLRASLAQPATRTALAQQAAVDDDAAAVARWLGRLSLLYGLPFAHLVPDVRMLPPESIRFFYVDPNWIGAMIDGALSIGLSTSQQVELQSALTTQLESMATEAALAERAKSLGQDPPKTMASPTAGFLLRSALASGWPGLTVSGKVGGADGAAVALLRLEHLAPDVLFCVFNGVPDTVTLAAPHEGLEFGVDDEGKIVIRTVTDGKVTNGSERPIYDPQNPNGVLASVRAGGQRVLNIFIDPKPGNKTPSTPVDLLGVIAKAKGKGITSIGPADFALHMVKGAEEITFSPSPPRKPA
jgi:hypothetical protein